MSSHGHTPWPGTDRLGDSKQIAEYTFDELTRARERPRISPIRPRMERRLHSIAEDSDFSPAEGDAKRQRIESALGESVELPTVDNGTEQNLQTPLNTTTPCHGITGIARFAQHPL